MKKRVNFTDESGKKRIGVLDPKTGKVKDSKGRKRDKGGCKDLTEV